MGTGRDRWTGCSETNLPGYVTGGWSGACDPDGSITLRPVTPTFQDDLTCFIANISVTTTSTPQVRSTTTTTLVLGADLPNTGGGQLLAILFSGFGLTLLGAGLVLLTRHRQPRWMV